MKSILRILFSVITIYACIAPVNASAETAPQFVLQGDNKKIQLNQYRGRVVYVDFWASWCDPCRQSFSWMNKMQSLYGEEKFSIIAINLDESHDAAKAFLNKTPANFDIAYDPLGRTAEAYKLKAMPSSFIINRQGKLVYRHIGFHSKDKDDLEKQIKQQLGKGVLAKK